MSGFKVGNVKLTGRTVRRRLNGHMVKILEPTRKISYEEANRLARKLVEKWEKERLGKQSRKRSK